MQDPQSIDHYFTEQIVGTRLTVDLGPAIGRREEPRRGVLVQALGGGAELSALALRSTWAADPAAVLSGQPVSLERLGRWRRGWLVGGALLWSGLLVAGCWTLWAR